MKCHLAMLGLELPPCASHTVLLIKCSKIRHLDGMIGTGENCILMLAGKQESLEKKKGRIEYGGWEVR